MRNIWPKNLIKSKPKRAILTGKWNFERSLIGFKKLRLT